MIPDRFTWIIGMQVENSVDANPANKISKYYWGNRKQFSKNLTIKSSDGKFSNELVKIKDCAKKTERKQKNQLFITAAKVLQLSLY